MDEQAIVQKASDRSKGGVVLKRQLSRDIAQQLRLMIAEQLKAGSKALDGLYLEEDARRYYPMGAFASQLIGLTSIDGTGQAGLEMSLDKYLSGKAGSVLSEIDGKGRLLPQRERVRASIDGRQRELTLDASIQRARAGGARGHCVNRRRPSQPGVDPKTASSGWAPSPSSTLRPPRDNLDAFTNSCESGHLRRLRPGRDLHDRHPSAARSPADHTARPVRRFGAVMGRRAHPRLGSGHGAQNRAKARQIACNPVFVELGGGWAWSALTSIGRVRLGSVTGVDVPGEGTAFDVETRV